jgi:MSHA biogenesis protein MshJ
LHQKRTAILNVVTRSDFKEQLALSKKQEGQSTNLKTQIGGVTSKVIPEEKIPDVYKDILNAQEGVLLIALKKLPPEPLVPAGFETIDLPSEFKNISKYTLQIEFQSNYFDTVEYFKRLEKLPWQLYWDNLEYKVTNYPRANVIVKLHFLIKQKST